MTKLVLAALLAVVIAFLVGWAWGATGRSPLNRALELSELRADLLQARGSVLGARVDLYNVNFGNASRQLEDAKDSMRRGSQRLMAVGAGEDAKRLETALSRIDEAQRLAGQLNQDANSRAADAVRATGEVLDVVRKR